MRIEGSGAGFNAEDAEGAEFFGVGDPLLEKLCKTFSLGVGGAAPAVSVRRSLIRRALDSRCGEDDEGVGVGWAVPFHCHLAPPPVIPAAAGIQSPFRPPTLPGNDTPRRTLHHLTPTSYPLRALPPLRPRVKRTPG